ncbi:hypothetical protein J7M07_09470 [bacterium]|nr:hypothetical protein [bacterium]
MKRTICAIICLTVLAGCQKHLKENVSDNLHPKRVMPVHYQVAINRTTTVEMQKDSGQSSPQTMTEKLTVNLSLQSANTMQDQVVFKAVCDSVHMSRSDFLKTGSGAEALRNLQGKEFTLTLSIEGEMIDDSSIRGLMKYAAKDSHHKSCKGTFREPDMLVDFYNIVSDLCTVAVKGNYPQGEKFIRHELTPTPAVEFSLPQRQITYTVDEVVNNEGVKKAHITEMHTIADDAQAKLPDIYSEGIKTKGLFSSLRRWRTQSIEGTGERVIDLDAGFLESLSQHWQVKATAGLRIPIRDVHPVITIDESIIVKRIQ